MTPIEEFISGLKPSQQPVAQLYLPVLTRWVGEAGWDVVRKALYVNSQLSWYKAVRKRMTPAERIADDKRARVYVNKLAWSKAQRVETERGIIQTILVQLLSSLLGKL